METKPASEWGKNWEASHGRVAAAFKSGVERNTTWHENAIKGQGNYEAKMTDPSVLARRAEKLRAVDQGKWKAKALDKGAKNIVTGMKAGKPDYDSAASKSQSILAGTTLPDRTTDVDANIMGRVGGVAHALKRGWGKE